MALSRNRTLLIVHLCFIQSKESVDSLSYNNNLEKLIILLNTCLNINKPWIFNLKFGQRKPLYEKSVSITIIKCIYVVIKPYLSNDISKCEFIHVRQNLVCQLTDIWFTETINQNPIYASYFSEGWHKTKSLFNKLFINSSLSRTINPWRRIQQWFMKTPLSSELLLEKVGVG